MGASDPSPVPFPSLDMLQDLNVIPELSGPELDTGFKAIILVMNLYVWDENMHISFIKYSIKLDYRAQ
ncbi:hypothetical protein DUI87_09424 [Hirundo rustica rustica]|uniref:Uncharacterized protein n=1 Tax=Hirundo rustica rustica TaxID=333673 RepID=A0A3M0KU83_HIRRU|nr:hypothetical protein DUI87_09424 [Hirundo rustica rustica]